MKILKWLLFPFAWLYGGIMAIRNFCYDQGYFKSERFDLPVISVGNLTVGGTGKTPHVEFLLRLLKNYKLATLSRGYKRKTKGFGLANENATAQTIGDEPFQYFLDFPEVTVAVSEKRATGINQIQSLKPETEIIILDDAYQHRAVTPTLNLLITDFYRRFDTDFMMPTGLLREPRSGAKRADAIIVSKCPEDLTLPERDSIKNSLLQDAKPLTPVFFTSYKYGKMVGFGGSKVVSEKVILVTGIANPEPLKNYLQSTGYTLLEHLNFPDHYAYTAGDVVGLGKLVTQFKDQNPVIVTTRKDAVKLMAPEFAHLIKPLPIFYVPIEVAFLEGQAAFEALVLKTVQG